MNAMHPLIFHPEQYPDIAKKLTPEQLAEIEASTIPFVQGTVSMYSEFKVMPTIPFPQDREQPGVARINTSGFLICSDGTKYRLSLHEQMLHRVGLLNLNIMDRQHRLRP
jgi:hypothetical protein